VSIVVARDGGWMVIVGEPSECVLAWPERDDLRTGVSLRTARLAIA
jgi:hypothetical protein